MGAKQISRHKKDDSGSASLSEQESFYFSYVIMGMWGVKKKGAC